jgi:hypothetical protein
MTHFASIPGRYDGPPMHLDLSLNNEVEVTVGDNTLALGLWPNCLDLLEASLAAAWALCPEQTVEILSRSRLRGFEVPPHLRDGAA